MRHANGNQRGGAERIRAVFDQLRRTRRKALIPFLMGGDPDLQTTHALILTLADAGADLIEVGIPFSDPLADGPIIQRASGRALAHGTTPAAIFRMLRQASRQVSIPLVVLSYWNPILRYGDGHRTATASSRFVLEAVRCGVSGMIVPDLPLEEARVFRAVACRVGLATIFLAAPTSAPHRLRQIARASEGFLYYVSLTGTTGVREQLAPEWMQKVRQLKLITTKPICVGFGISTPAQAAAVARVADGVIVGSAVIRAMEPYLRQPRTAIRQAWAFVRRMRNAV